MNVLDLTPEQLRQMHDTVERFQKYCDECRQKLQDLGLPFDDVLVYQLDRTRREVKNLTWVAEHYSKPENRTGPPPRACRPMTVGEYLDSHNYVVASCIVRENGRTLHYQVAVAADTPCPIPRDFEGSFLPPHDRWIGGGRDQADGEGRMIDHGGVTLSSSPDSWEHVRHKSEGGKLIHWPGIPAPP